MNNYDEKIDNEIRKIFKKEVDKPLKFKYTIQNFDYNNNQKNKRTFAIRFATVMACLAIVSTTSLATVEWLKNKIWKNPTIITEEEITKAENTVKSPVTSEEKEKFVSQDVALKNANLIINKMGYENIELKDIELIRDYDNGIHYKIYLKNQNTNDLEILINLNPYSGKLEYFCDYTSINKERNFDEVPEHEIKEIAIKYYKALDIYYESDDIIEIKKQPIYFGNIKNDMWQVTFGEKYNNMDIPGTKYSICFNVENSKPIIYIIKAKEVENIDFNKVEIAKEEAIKIAIEKEKSFSDLPIDEINVELSVKKMNIFIYCLENEIENNDGNLKIDDISRVVWIVEIKHNKDFPIRKYDLKSVKTLYNKQYYIDAETGEIIGGEQTEFFQ